MRLILLISKSTHNKCPRFYSVPYSFIVLRITASYGTTNLSRCQEIPERVQVSCSFIPRNESPCSITEDCVPKDLCPATTGIKYNNLCCKHIRKYRIASICTWTMRLARDFVVLSPGRLVRFAGKKQAWPVKRWSYKRLPQRTPPSSILINYFATALESNNLVARNYLIPSQRELGNRTGNG